MYFEAKNYRQAISSKIKLKGLTHEKFIKDHPKILTFSSFEAFMSGYRRLSLKTFIRLGRDALRAKPFEVLYLYLLSQENDLDLGDEEEMNIKIYLESIRLKLLPFLRGDYETKKPVGDVALIFNELFEMLNKKERSRVLNWLELTIENKIPLLKNEEPGNLLLARLKKLK